jgi:hypothetical protein
LTSTGGAEARDTFVFGQNGATGSITDERDERERQAIIVAAENAPGVKAVDDHLAWIDTQAKAL